MTSPNIKDMIKQAIDRSMADVEDRVTHQAQQLLEERARAQTLEPWHQ